MERLLHFLPAPVHRLACKAGYALRKAYLRQRGGTLSGCSIIARDGQGRVLLVRHSYGPNVWSFPGGGLRAGEDPHAGAIREFSEELGCALTQMTCLGQAQTAYHGALNISHVFTGLLAGQEPQPDGREIVEARFFALADIPDDCSRSAHNYLKIYAASQE